VFGCGGDRDASKRPRMGEAAARCADKVIVTDDNPRSEDPAAIRRAVMAGAPHAQEVAGRVEAIRVALSQLGAGDVLVVAGKGHETTQIIGSNVTHHHDGETLLDIAGSLPLKDSA
jgi:UDP-N-acetylmuramoyl-L-alanyl-D-glutamate--2,6-diaminopimelate ligase